MVVWRLDRLGRSLKDLIALVELENRKIGFRSRQEKIDTTTSGGKLIFHLFGALAEFKRNLIRERIQGGLASCQRSPRGTTMEVDARVNCHWEIAGNRLKAERDQERNKSYNQGKSCSYPGFSATCP